MKYIISLVVFASLVLVPASTLVEAQTSSSGVQSATGGIQPAGKATADKKAEVQIKNPLSGVNSISDLIFKIVNFVYSLSYIVIVVFLIISGFKFIQAQGNEEGLKKAKNTFLYTIIGAALIVGAQVITSVLKGVLNSLQ